MYNALQAIIDCTGSESGHIAVLNSQPKPCVNVQELVEYR